MLTQRIKKYIADLLPLDCELCGLTKASTEQSFCQTCHSLVTSPQRCLRCGLPMNTAQSVCGTCLRVPPAWQRLYCVGSYQQPLSGYIHQFKYEGQFLQADKLATLLSPLIESPAEVMTSVPLYWQRHMKRGFNQSELLAVSLAKQLERPYVPMFQRVRATEQQQGLSRQQRQVNLANAFRLKSVKNYQHVAIVDDVVTTGSTVHHLCKLLLDAGVKSVDIYCICRTPDSGT